MISSVLRAEATPVSSCGSLLIRGEPGKEPGKEPGREPGGSDMLAGVVVDVGAV